MDKQRLLRNSVLMVALFIFGFVVEQNSGFAVRLLDGYFFASVPWGWSILNRITPRMFLFMSWGGWVIYFAVKLCLALMIGMFVTPYMIYKIVKGLKDVRVVEKYTKDASM